MRRYDFNRRHNTPASDTAKERVPYSEVEVIAKLATILTEHMSPEQLASAMEQFELVCEQNGWDIPALRQKEE